MPDSQSSEGIRARRSLRAVAGGLVLVALVLMPAPMLPPHWLAEGVQSAMSVSWKSAYLVATVGLQVGFYGALGVLAALAADRASTPSLRILQTLLLPLAVVATAVVIRSLKVGYLPLLANAAIPIAACVFGTGIGLGLLYRGWKLALLVAAGVLGAAIWGFLGGGSELGRETTVHLRQLVDSAPGIESGDARFGRLMQAAFAPLPGADAAGGTAVSHNRAAILALGIAVGHERLARFVGLDPKGELVRAAVGVRQGTMLRGRQDWPRHYALSAALAVLEHPLVSDVAGLMKEQLDALTRGSGFSFGDLAADRAGVRFAVAATRSETGARRMQARLQAGFAVDDFFPVLADLPESLTVEQFRREYGGVGSPLYRDKAAEIEARLDGCKALALDQHEP